MEQTIQLIVTALVAGATAALEGTASQAVKDAYEGLKTLIKSNYPDVGVDRLAAKPNSGPRRDAVQEDLEETAAATDAELLRRAQALLKTIKSEATNVKGISLQEIEAAAINLNDIIAQGAGNVTGVEVKGAKLQGDLNISGVRAGNMPLPAPGASAQSKENPTAIKILFLAANPGNTTRLRIDDEIRGIDQALQQSELRDHFELISHGAVRREDLQSLLLRHKPHIVHFSGHGEKHEIILQDARGNSAPVGREALADLFRILKDNIRCVVLNACYSAPQAEAIGEHIDIVIGMSDAILDDSARHFSHSFYQALGYGGSVKRAFELGKNIIELQDLGESYKLQMKYRIDPGTLYLAQAKPDDPKA